MSLRAILLAGSALIALGTGSARAQTPSGGSASPVPPPPPAASQGLSEVVVTAQFKQENLQQTPLAITAFTAEQLDNQGISTAADIARSSPGVELTPAPNATGAGKAVMAYIRGVGQNDLNPVFDPGVGFYVDGVYYSTLFGTSFDLLDLERVEVLRGPQGTLFGKNTEGGAINFISKQPDNDFGGYGEVTYGSYNLVKARFAVNIPVIPDKLFVRVSFLENRQDGYVDRIDFACAHPSEAGSLKATASAASGCKLGTEGGTDVQAGRIAIRMLPTDNLEISLVGDITNDNSEVGAETVYGIQQGGLLAGYNKSTNLPRFGIPYDNRFISGNFYQSYATFNDPATGFSAAPTAWVHDKGIAGTIQYKLGDTDWATDLQLKSITAYRSYNGYWGQDQSAAPLAVAVATNNLYHDQVSEELQALGKSFDGHLEWVGGFYYFNADNTYASHQDIAIIPLTVIQSDPSSVQDLSGFVHGIYHLTDKLNLTAGLRYTYEQKIQTFVHSIFPPPGYFTGNVRYYRLDPKVELSYQFDDDTLGYVEYSTGFRGGGFNPRPFTIAQIIPFYPESLQAYEIGLKTDLLDHRLRLNLSGYYNQYQNFQVSTLGVDASGTPFSAPRNVGAAAIEGLEIESEYRPIPNLTFSGSFAYTHVDLQNLGPYANTVGSGLPPLSGTLQDTPTYKGSLAVEYAIDAGRFGVFTPRVDASYQSKVYWDVANSDDTAQDGMALFNGRLNWQPTDDAWTATFFVTNLTDRQYCSSKFNNAAQGLATLLCEVAPPREFGFTVKRTF